MTARSQRETVSVRFVRQPQNLHEIMCRLEQPGALERVMVEATKSMSVREYDEFVLDFSLAYDWLEGQGGACGHRISRVIEVTAPDRLSLYINAEGYGYPRYVEVVPHQASL